MRKRAAWRAVALLALASFLAAPAARAQSVAFGATASTLGPGLVAAAPLGPNLGVRAGAHYFAYSRTSVLTDAEVDLEYEGDLTLTSVSLLVDWRPFGNTLRLSGGALYNRNHVDATFTPIESYTIEGKTFAPERIGVLEATLEHRRKLNPYLGVGLGRYASGRFGLQFDAGAVYTDAPRVTMTGRGLIAPTAEQAPDLEAGLQSFRFYPVVSLGFTIGL